MVIIKKIKQIIAAFILLIAFLSCTSVRYIDIQILKPAEINYPNKIDKLYILDVNKVAYNSESKTDLKNYKLAIIAFNKTLDAKLRESPLFENTDIIYTNYPKMLEDYKQTEFYKRKNTNVCAINRINLVEKTKIMDEGYYFVSRYSIIYALDVKFYNMFNPPDSGKMGYLIADTVFWESTSDKSENIDAQFDKDEAFSFIGKDAAKIFCNKIAPFWETEERTVYYNSNRYMKNAYTCFENNDLNKAISIWEKVYPLATKKMAAITANNLALSYELLDSLDMARSWAQKSFEMNRSPETNQYVEILQKRIKEKNILNNQLKQTKR
jgi:hypothetical protein